MRISSITKNAGKACNNRLYRHIRTFEKIVKNYFVIFTNNIQDYIFTFTEIIFFTTSKKRKAFEKLFASYNHLIYFMTAEYTHDTVGHFLLLPVRLLRTSCILLLPLRLPTLPGSRFLPSLTGFCDDPAGMLLT